MSETLSIAELREALPAGAYFTIKYIGEVNSRNSQNAGRRKVLKWSRNELSCTKCDDGEVTYVTINNDFYAYRRDRGLIFAYRESGEFAEITDIQTGAGYAKKEVATWEGKVRKI